MIIFEGNELKVTIVLLPFMVQKLLVNLKGNQIKFELYKL